MTELKLNHLYKKYPNSDFYSVEDFNLHIQDKEFIVFVGPSGCGKSTTLRMIAGLEDITGGELYIGDQLVNEVAPKDRDIAMVFQNYALYPHMTVYENMAFGLKLRKYSKDAIDQRVKEAAEILGLTEFDRLEENPSMYQGVSVDEAVVIIMLEIKMQGLSGVLNVCIPGTLMSDIFEVIDKTKHLADVDDAGVRQSDRDDILDSIRNSELDVMAQLGIARLSLDDVYNFQVGDVINLNKPKDSDVTLHIAGQPWFVGQLGVHNKNMAVKIQDRVEEE